MAIPELLALIESLQSRPANDTERRIASAIVVVVDHEHPAFGDALTDEVVMLETAWRESAFRLDAVGDHHRSIGPFQIQRVARSTSLLDQAAIAYARLRESARRCGTGDGAVAAYVSGRCDRGLRVSAFRMAEVRRWRSKVNEDGVAEAQR